MKAKKRNLKGTPKRQATCLRCGSFCFYLAYSHTIPHARKKYPKCTALAGCSSLHPPGFKTVEDAFKWPHIFLHRISHHYGAKWLCERLQAWRWNFSSNGCFSIQFLCRLPSKPHELFIGCEHLWVVSWGARPSKSFEALASLQSAATQVLVENGCKPATDSNPHVRGHFACEIDKHCQKVLGETYGCCCFQNILEFNAEQKTHYCATHQQQCLTKKKTLGDDKRSSAKN